MMATWLEYIILAFENCGGIADYNKLYSEIKKIREDTRLPPTWKAIVRGTIEHYSSDSEKFNGLRDIFYSVEGIGKGVWGLRDSTRLLFIAKDIDEPDPASRSMISVYRILRDSDLARRIKLLHGNRCQICGKTIRIGNRDYSEAHHIQPLGKPHNGPDIAGNIIVLCPDHHVQCDFGGIRLNLDEIRQHSAHRIEAKYVDYHNRNIAL